MSMWLINWHLRFHGIQAPYKVIFNTLIRVARTFFTVKYTLEWTAERDAFRKLTQQIILSNMVFLVEFTFNTEIVHMPIISKLFHHSSITWWTIRFDLSHFDTFKSSKKKKKETKWKVTIRALAIYNFLRAFMTLQFQHKKEISLFLSTLSAFLLFTLSRFVFSSSNESVQHDSLIHQSKKQFCTFSLAFSSSLMFDPKKIDTSSLVWNCQNIRIGQSFRLMLIAFNLYESRT